MPSADNPPNPLLPTRCEWLGPAPPARLAVREERARSLITTNDSPDIPYRWSANPYRGCAHACAYCYARRTHEYLDLGAGTDFETCIVVKVNAPDLLQAELRHPAWRREPLAFSGVTDCYQPLEARYALTRRCLEACLAVAQPVSVCTKSDLVTRDIPLLTELHRRSSASILLSIALADDALAARLEPGAPPPSLRFAAMRRLRAAGLPVGLLVAPVIPGLNDRDIPALLERAAAAGATAAWYAPVRLPGSVADVFLARLRRHLPAAAARVEARIRDLRGGRLNDPAFGCRMEGRGPYWESVQRLFETVATRCGLAAGQSWCRAPSATDPPAPRQLTFF